jgi:hypothetical protein
MLSGSVPRVISTLHNVTGHSFLCLAMHCTNPNYSIAPLASASPMYTDPTLLTRRYR